MDESSWAQGIARRSRAALYISLYILLSGGQIFFNKWVLSPSHFNFPFPVTLTTYHMVFSSVLCFLVFHVFKLRKLAHTFSWQQYFKLIVPIGAMFAMTLWFGNTAFLYISLSFAQMLKACLPVVVLLISAAVGLEELTWRMLGIMSVISGGVLLASAGEVSFSWAGVAYQMLGVVGEAARLILAELLLKKRGMSLDPLSMMYYVSPASAACLLLPWYSLEYPLLMARLRAAAADDAAGGAPSLSLLQVLLGTSAAAARTAADGAGAPAAVFLRDAGMLTLNALCTFALNLSVFLVILHTSALTIRVAGVVKDWLVVLVSALLFADTRLTPLNVFGYAVAIAGVVLYQNTRLKAPPTSPPHPASAAAEKERGRERETVTDEEASMPLLDITRPVHRSNSIELPRMPSRSSSRAPSPPGMS